MKILEFHKIISTPSGLQSRCFTQLRQSYISFINFLNRVDYKLWIKASKYFFFFASVNIKIIAGKMDVHIILDDPAGNSYLQVNLFPCLTLTMKHMMVNTDNLIKIKQAISLCRTFMLQTLILRWRLKSMCGHLNRMKTWDSTIWKQRVITRLRIETNMNQDFHLSGLVKAMGLLYCIYSVIPVRVKSS